MHGVLEDTVFTKEFPPFEISKCSGSGLGSTNCCKYLGDILEDFCDHTCGNNDPFALLDLRGKHKRRIIRVGESESNCTNDDIFDSLGSVSGQEYRCLMVLNNKMNVLVVT